jgi:signal transduction histidine kinase
VHDLTARHAPEVRSRLGDLLPAWWRSGTRTWLWWGAVAITIAHMTDIYFETAGGWFTWKQGAAVGIGAAAEVGVGLLFWMWRPGNLVGPLMVAAVTVPHLYSLQLYFPHSRLAVTAILLAPVWIAMLVHWWFLFPTGRMWNRWAKWLTIWTYAVFFSQWVPLLMFSSYQPHSYLYVGHGWSDLAAWSTGWAYVLALTWVAIDVALVVRLVQATPGARLRLLPLYAGVLPIWTLWVYSSVPEGRSLPFFQGNYFTAVATFISAVGASFGLYRVRHRRRSVADLVVELGEIEPGGVRDALARTLRDPTLVLGLWLPDQHTWVDGEGGRVELPADGSRGVTYIGDRLAVLVHDRDLLDQPRLLEAAGSAARLALENERLQAELRAKLAELRASRARIVRASDEERRRLERDLHDGAQQRLLSLGMALQLLHGRGDGEALLMDAEAELQQALAELRELARGIHPAILTDHGLADAIRSLAQRAPVPVEIETSADRLPEPVETACYFVVSEALANVAKYAHATKAWIRLDKDDGTARIEVRDNGVGGADPDRKGSSGLRALGDRVGALDGTLTIDSPENGGTVVRAEIPCAS